MRLLLAVLCILGVGGGVHSHAIRYPYRAELLSYAPARGEFPVQNAQAHGYIRYLADDGSERLISYKYPEPLYGVRRVGYAGEQAASSALLKSSAPTTNNKIDVAELQKAQVREDNFRAWCQQRYQALQAETERLRAEGKQPPADVLAQIKPLEAILGADGNAIGETAEVTRAREEHLRIWNEARLKVLQLEAEQLKLQGGQTAEAQPMTYERIEEQKLIQPIAVVGETDEQKKAREEHLRIYNEQLLRLQQLQAEQLRESERPTNIAGGAVLLKEAISPAQTEQKIVEYQQQVVQETPEVLRAKEEHLRLWNEAKLRAEQEAQKQEAQPLDATVANVKAANPASTDELSPAQPQLQQQQQQQQQQQIQISELKIQTAPGITTDAFPVLPLIASSAPGIPTKGFPALPTIDPIANEGSKVANIQQDAQESIALNVVPGIQQPNPAAILAQSIQSPGLSYATPQLKDISLLTPTVPAPQAPAQIQDTIEVQRAREEHLKIVKEAQIKATQNSIQTQQSIGGDVTAGELQESDRLRAAEEKLSQEERLREEQRIKEEQRLLAAERIRLQQEEERRVEMERLAELEQRKEAIQAPQLIVGKQEQRIEQPTIEQVKIQLQPAAFGAAALTKSASAASEQYSNNPFLLRFAAPAGIAAGTSAFFIGQQKPVQYPNAGYYYLPDAKPNDKVDTLIRQLQIAGQNAIPQGLNTPTIALRTQDTQQQQQQQSTIELKPDVKHTANTQTIVAAVAQPNNAQDSGLAELERATREHFRAHEIALEQLRLANVQSGSKKDCN